MDPEKLARQQRWALPWIMAIAAIDIIAIAVFVLGWVTDTAWATFTALGLIWVAAAVVLAMCWAGHRKGWR